MVLPDKDRYTLDELFNNLPISLRELSRRSGVNKVTINSIANKKRIPHKSTINRLLPTMSEVYGKNLTWENLAGMDIEEEKPEHE